MSRNPFTKALSDTRRGLIGWVLAIGAVGLMYTSFYPSMDTPQMTDVINGLPEGVREAFGISDLSSPQGYLGSYVFGLIVPVLLAVFMVILGSRLIAADEEAGQLDLVLAHPVGRARLLLSRLGAVAVAAITTGVVVYLLLLAVSGPARIGSVGAGNLAAACLELALFGLLIGTLTLAVGAATGRRAASVAVGTLVLVLGYVAKNLAPRVAGLAWAQRVSPFYWAAGHEPLRHGVDLADCGLLVGTAAVLAALGLVAFTRRDLGT